MAHAVEVLVDGRTVPVDGRDAAAWLGRRPPADPGDPEWVSDAADYVEAHPRAPKGTAESQRLAMLRRLAAGPATRAELLAAMRSAGWVGASDLENRLRDLRASDTRAGLRAGRLRLETDGQRYWLAEPFALIDDADRRALGFAKAMVRRLDGPMPVQASVTLDRLLPGVEPGGGQRMPASYRASSADFQRFDAALVERRPVRVHYFSLNSGRDRSYDLVPVEYVTLGATLKAVCVEVNAFGRRAGPDRQFALDRLLSAEELPEWPSPAPAELALARSEIVLDVTDALYQVMRQRNLFGIDETAEHSEHDEVWRVRGEFPVALAWDVMEQLCAWSGNAQVHSPYWLVNAVCRRLRAGLRVMEEGGDFELVKPDPDRQFASHGDAVAAEAPPPPSRPRKLLPPQG